MDSFLEEFFEFSNLIGKLKKIERFKGQYYWRDYPTPSRYDSVADHSWRMALLVMLFEDKLSKEFDSEKALKMALIHDIPEILAGDASPLGSDGTGKDAHSYNDELKKERHEAEKNAAREIFGKLSEEKNKELMDLWLEYEKQESFEARVVKALDRIEATLQVLEYRNGHMFPKHLEFSMDYSLKDVNADPAIYQFGLMIVDEMRKRYREFKKAEE
jgi:putative hydrolase of HD superfamily